jgi:hypothetical protein
MAGFQHAAVDHMATGSFDWRFPAMQPARAQARATLRGTGFCQKIFA